MLGSGVGYSGMANGRVTWTEARRVGAGWRYLYYTEIAVSLRTKAALTVWWLMYTGVRQKGEGADEVGEWMKLFFSRQTRRPLT